MLRFTYIYQRKSTMHVFKISKSIIFHIFVGMLKLQFTSNPPARTAPVQSEASAAWAHRRRKQLPAAVARACRVPGAELWVTRRQLAEDAV